MMFYKFSSQYLNLCSINETAIIEMAVNILLVLQFGNSILLHYQLEVEQENLRIGYHNKPFFFYLRCIPYTHEQ